MAGARRDELHQLGELVGNLRVPYVEKVLNRIGDWRDPRAKALRRRRRAVRTTKVWTGAGVGTGAGAVVVDVAVAAPGASLPILIGAAVVSGAGAVVSGVRTWRLHREELPAAVKAPVALPPRGSLARDPLRRLDEAERSLDELLSQLSAAGTVSADSVGQARRTGAEAAEVLRGLGLQIDAIERAREHAPPAERGYLNDGVRRLRNQLDDGLDAYGSLVAATARTLAASSTGAPRESLTEATDHLAGLALALRDLSPD